MGKVTLAIDASRNRSGGAIEHMLGLITNLDPISNGIDAVHIWSYRDLLNRLPDYPWLIKHNPKSLEQSLAKQLFWQFWLFHREIIASGCDILFSADASTLCRFSPMVVLSQDMLSYEPGVMKYFGFSLARVRLISIYYIQNLAFRRADGVIFLTHYSGKIIQKSCGPLSSVAYIPHGVSKIFRSIRPPNAWPDRPGKLIHCVYVSNIEMYKHQWVVVEAISKLRARGHNLTLSLVGGGGGRAHSILQNAIEFFDPNGDFVEQLDFLPHARLPEVLSRTDIFVFASSCENMPITLLEAMSMGLPIACSNRGPMPEVLVNAGLFFDPEDAGDISNAIEQFIKFPELRMTCSQRAIDISLQYSWSRCADETFSYIRKTYLSINA